MYQTVRLTKVSDAPNLKDEFNRLLGKRVRAGTLAGFCDVTQAERMGYVDRGGLYHVELYLTVLPPSPTDADLPDLLGLGWYQA